MKGYFLKLASFKEWKILFLVYLFGLFLRFLYFPNDISFGYDQARDAYVSLHAISGDLKILGPQASVPGIYHGALVYYILGPLYKLFAESPFAVAAVFRIVNTSGILLTFLFLKLLYKSNRASLLGAFLFSLSFEQTQFSLFLGHPALGVITVLIFYIGLALLFFSKKPIGLCIACYGLGLTIQFHFSSISLFAVLILTLFVFRKSFPKIGLKKIIVSFLILMLTLSTYILAEFKYGFRTTKTLLDMYLSESSGGGLKIQNIVDIPARVIENNFINSSQTSFLILIILIAMTLFFAKKEKKIEQILFLLILFTVAIVPYIFYVSVQPSFYYSLGASVALIAIVSFVLDNIFSKSKLIGYFLMSVILISNLKLITTDNPKGTVPEINAQEGMLLTDAIKVMDYMYTKANGKYFAVSAVTIPYNINSTWSYLFEWYGLRRYGYLPIWGGENALGFENVLVVELAQSKLPTIKFTIIEPTRGLTRGQIESFLVNENIFWRVVDEVRYGQFTVQYRIFKTLS